MNQFQTKLEDLRIEYASNSYKEMELEIPVFCPICGFSHNASFLKNFFYRKKEGISIAAFFTCPNCLSTYCVNYLIPQNSVRYIDNPSIFKSAHLKSIIPNEQQAKSFPFDDVVLISNRANEVFKQSQKAELSGLDEISGMGYRKCLEILIKDYLIHLNKEDEETIKRRTLNASIDKLNDENLEVLATRCSWLGNDEAHYIRKHSELDIENLKELLDGVVTFIHLKLLLEKAAKITPK